MKVFKKLPSVSAAVMALVLALCLSLSLILLPKTVLAASAISKIEIVDVIEPLNGQTPDYNTLTVVTEGVSETGAGTYINWYYSADSKNWESMKYENISFGYGTYYRCQILVAPEDNYAFADKVTATINGHEAEVEVRRENNYAVVSYVFAPMSVKTIRQVDLVIPSEPAAGAAVDYDNIFVPTGDSYGYVVRPLPRSEKTLSWSVSEDGINFRPMNAEDPFEGGLYYKLKTRVVSFPGYCFAQDTAVKINGKDCDLVGWGFGDAQETENGSYEDCIDIECVFGPLFMGYIKTVEILDVVEPSVGADYEAETFRLPADASYDLIGAGTTLHWDYSWDGKSFSSMKEPTAEGYNILKFRAGCYHKLTATVLAAKAYLFDEAVSVTVNGKPAAILNHSANTDGQEYLNIEIIFKPIMLGTVTEVRLDNLSRPTIGGTPNPSFYTLSGSDGLSLDESDTALLFEFSEDGSSYADMLASEDTSVFRKDCYYRVGALVIAAEGYEVSPNVTVTINGQEAEISRMTTKDGVTSFYVSYDFGQLNASDRTPYLIAASVAGGIALISLLVLIASRRKKGMPPVFITK